MTEFDDIFAHDLTTIVFVCSSIAMLIAFALAALWPVGSARSTTRALAGRAWMRADSPSLAAATRH